MPMGPYKDFSACLMAYGKKGRSKASASRICGAIKARTEGKKKLEKSAEMNFNFEKYLPISKVNDEERMVYGYASTPDLDSQGEIVELEAIKKALPSYMKFPTIREMHTTNAVGRTKSAKVDDKGLFIQAKIVDDNAWKKVKEGVFNGFSIGGKAVQMIGNTIKELRLTEISLVDVPANKSAVITLFKADVDEVYSKYHSLVNMSASSLENWSKTECSKKASLNRSPITRNINLLKKKKSEWTSADVRSANRTISFISRMKGAEQGKTVADGCPSKRDISLKNWGYNPSTSKVEKALEKAEVKIGDMVEWNSSGGKARGKVTRIIRNGKVSIPDSSFEITGDSENPALLIRIYREQDGEMKPTNRIVGHKMKTVRRIGKGEVEEIIKFNFSWEEVSQLEEIKKHEDNVEIVEGIEETQVVNEEQVVVEESLSEDEKAEVEDVLAEITDADVEQAIAEVVEAEAETEAEKSEKLTDNLIIEETLGKIEKMEKAYEKQIEKFDSIEKMDKAISKLTSIVEKLSERLEKVESTPAESKTKASFLVEKTLGGVQIEKRESVELEKAKSEFADLMRIRETNPERYALEKMSDRAFELKDKIARLSN